MLRAGLFLILLLLPFLNPSSASEVSISLSPQVLPRSGDPVRISWSGIDAPSDLDWVGIYSPPTSPHDNFIGYVFLSASSPSWRSGTGSVDLPLVNLRSDYEFRIFRWTRDEVDRKRHDHDQNPLPGIKHLLAKSTPLGFERGRGPEQIHLAYTDRDDEMRVMFVTGEKVESLVRYGLEEDRLGDVVRTQVVTYRREEMCDSPANQSVGWRDPGYIHDGVMTNLAGGKRYYYKVGSNSLGWSPIHSFMSRNGDSDETLAFLFGDMGAATPYSTFIRTQEESKSTIRWILRDLETLGNRPAFISHIGDISYARGYSWVWDTFFTQIEPVASRVPYHVCIGNHEYDWPDQPWLPNWSAPIYGKDGGGECGVPYSLRFHMPGNSSEPTGTHAPATRNLFYSFDMGSVHFVYVSTETNFLPGSPQYKFVKWDLESVDRGRTPFVVVQGHRPMYTTSNEYRDTPLRERLLRSLEPLLVQNNVTLALWGHVHRYERFCRLSNYTCVGAGKGTVQAVIGMGGQDWQPSWEPRKEHPEDPIYPQPERSMYRGGEFGYTRMVATKEKLTLSYVGNHDGQVHDVLEILASGEALSSGGADMVEGEGVGLVFSVYLKGAAVLVLGAFVGYVIGLVSRARREAVSGKSWVPVKSDEI